MSFGNDGEQRPLLGSPVNSARTPGASSASPKPWGNHEATPYSSSVSLVPSLAQSEESSADASLVAQNADREIESIALKKVIWFATVAAPSLFTIIGYLMINLGNAPPAEKDRNMLNVFLATALGMGLNAAVSSTTNLIFTAINTHNELYHNAIKCSAYQRLNLLKVAISTVFGITSGLNYVPLMKAVVPQLFTNLSMGQSLEVPANALAGAFTATMMLLNAMSVYEIGFQEIPDGYNYVMRKWRGAEILVENGVGAKNTAGVLAQEEELADGVVATSSAEKKEPCMSMATAQNLLLWGCSLAMASFYYYQLTKYLEKGFEMSPYLAGLAAGGDFMFGISYAKKGFRELGRGVLNVSNEPSVKLRILKGVFGVLSLTWAFFTIIPAMAQGQAGLAKFGMAATSEIFNLGSSVRLINAVAALLLLNVTVAGYSLYKTRESDGKNEKGALQDGFYTGKPVADVRASPWLSRLCGAQQGYLGLEDGSAATVPTTV